MGKENPAFFEDIVRIQRGCMERIDPSQIPSGTGIPLGIIQQHFSSGAEIIDMGGGAGRKSGMLREHGYSPIIVDINDHALSEAQGCGLGTVAADVTDSVALVHIIREQYPQVHIQGVIMEALLCNLIGDGWVRALRSAYTLMPNGGTLCVADVLQSGEYNPVLEQNFNTPEEFLEWKKLWENRYRNNMNIGLPFGTFVVAKLGHSKELEYGTPEELNELFLSDNFERFAQHFLVGDLNAGLIQEGFVGVEKILTFWKSREGRLLSGIICIARKK